MVSPTDTFLPLKVVFDSAADKVTMLNEHTINSTDKVTHNNLFNFIYNTPK